MRATVSKNTQVLPTIRVQDGDSTTDAGPTQSQNGAEPKTSGRTVKLSLVIDFQRHNRDFC